MILSQLWSVNWHLGGLKCIKYCQTPIPLSLTTSQQILNNCFIWWLSLILLTTALPINCKQCFTWDQRCWQKSPNKTSTMDRFHPIVQWVATIENHCYLWLNIWQNIYGRLVTIPSMAMVTLKNFCLVIVMLLPQGRTQSFKRPFRYLDFVFVGFMHCAVFVHTHDLGDVSRMQRQF